MRVLVAEDEEVMADALARGLRRAGYAADVATDGGTALELAALNPYDVVLLDRDLPVVHGDDVCRALVASGSPARILMLTAAGGLQEKVDGFGARRRRLPGQAVRVRRAARPRAGPGPPHRARRSRRSSRRPASGWTSPGGR